jgi:para-aminobenzoate synthetase/4-amino-4-deoxychorismate lyase
VTGAPKIRSMEIIRELESLPRGVYCGTVGYWSPGRDARFNVAIRTISCDARSGVARYPVGSGITWDSAPQAEYRECLLKAEGVQRTPTAFSLLETMLWDGEFRLLDEHLRRIIRSAEYFSYPFDTEAIRQCLDEAVHAKVGAQRVRLLLEADGEISVETRPVGETPAIHFAWAAEPIDSANAFMYHKTTHRVVYDAARAAAPGADDVLLWNEDGEVTEFTSGNVVVELDGKKYTPPVAAGLLAGTFRERLLLEGQIVVQALTRRDVEKAERVWFINSVRGWVDARCR